MKILCKFRENYFIYFERIVAFFLELFYKKFALYIRSKAQTFLILILTTKGADMRTKWTMLLATGAFIFLILGGCKDENKPDITTDEITISPMLDGLPSTASGLAVKPGDLVKIKINEIKNFKLISDKTKTAPVEGEGHIGMIIDYNSAKDPFPAKALLQEVWVDVGTQFVYTLPTDMKCKTHYIHIGLLGNDGNHIKRKTMKNDAGMQSDVWAAGPVAVTYQNSAIDGGCVYTVVKTDAFVKKDAVVNKDTGKKNDK